MSHENTPDEPLVRYEVADGVATVTLDSPHNRNALSRRLVTELLAALERAAADEAARRLGVSRRRAYRLALG